MSDSRLGPETLRTSLTPKEFGLSKGISVKTLANQRSAGRGVPFVRYGRSIRYRAEDIAAYELANRSATLDAA